MLRVRLRGPWKTNLFNFGGISVKGVQFVVNERGKKTAVVIDLKRHSELWEDFYDAAVARERQSEPRETWKR